MTEKAYQHTICKALSYSGIGLHSGKEVLMTLKPADVNTGIVFVRTDLPGCPQIRALAMMEIDNIIIEMSSPEPPVTDGSAKVFCELLEEAGVEEQQAERKVYAVDKAFAVYDNDRYITILPYDGYRISFTSINKHPLLGTQYFDVLLDKETFKKEIMAARTVAFTEELEMLRKMGLGLGGSLENVVVFDKDKILSEPRFEDELIRHKILDVIGDLYLLGPIKAHVIAVKTGHAFNSQIAKQIQAYRAKEE